MGPIVTDHQGLKVTFNLVTLISMDQEEAAIREAFAARMNEICDDKGLPAGRGRQSELAGLFKVTGKAARKWLLGLGYPEMAMAIRLADWAEVNLNWLLQGNGPKRGTRIDAKVLALDEALHSLPRESGLDLIDNLRAKLIRFGKLRAEEPTSRYNVMLDAYENELSRKAN